jgi:hypothetical protein
MTTRVFLAGVFGGIAMFIWSSIAHMALPTAEAGISEIPNEAATLAAMQAGLGDKAGLYIFPGSGLGPNATRQERHEAMKRMGENYARNASGLLMYNPPGRPLSMGKLLGIEFATELLESILIVALLAQTRLAGFGGRMAFVTVGGILAAVATNVPYWNWYGFPCLYTASYMFMQIVGFFCAGLVAALILRNRPFQSAAS